MPTVNIYWTEPMDARLRELYNAGFVCTTIVAILAREFDYPKMTIGRVSGRLKRLRIKWPELRRIAR